ncbi:MAG TPA: PQQ-binding-like beta-propeller repeat protein, partial [Armatimonadota bacterium]
MINLKALSLSILLGVILVLPAPFAAAKTFRIAQVSDCHLRGDGLHNKQLQAVIDEINSSVPKLDFVLSTGDYTDWGTADQFERYQQVISSLTVPIYTAIGNHEVKWSPWAKTGQERFLDKKLYYSFDHEGVHFIAMDSTIWLEHNSYIDPLELQWLKKDLQRTGTQMPVVIFYHHCPNYVTNESALLDILKPYNVKLALVGHEHIWDTYVRNGIQFQLAMNCYPDPGNYRIVEFDDSTIKSYRKVVGKEAVPDGEFTLSPVKNPVRLISPTANKHLNASFEAVAESEVPMQKFEFAVDGVYQTASRSDDGRYHATFSGKIIPGHHIVTARGTDASGGEWLQSAPVTLGDTGREAWRFKARGAVQRSVTVKDGRLFFGCTGGNVYALDAATGKQIWKVNVGSDVISKMAVENGTVFFGNTGGEIIALSAETGNRIWANKFAGPVQASPVVENSIVYTGAGNGGFYAIDAATGRVIW